MAEDKEKHTSLPHHHIEHNQALMKKMDILIGSIDKVYPSVQTLITRSFISGVFTGLGATIGVSIILTLITFILGELKVIPAFKDLIIQSQIERVLPNNR